MTTIFINTKHDYQINITRGHSSIFFEPTHNDRPYSPSHFSQPTFLFLWECEAAGCAGVAKVGTFDPTSTRRMIGTIYFKLMIVYIQLWLSRKVRPGGVGLN